MKKENNAWNLKDYCQGPSYDEIADQKERDRQAEIERIKKASGADDFSDFEEGASLGVRRYEDFQTETVEDSEFPLPIDVTGVDLTTPPGFVGDLADWMDGQCRYPRRRLYVAAALSAVGNLGGMSHYDVHGGVTSNLMAFYVAASSTGKEAVLQAFNQVHIAAGVQGL